MCVSIPVDEDQVLHWHLACASQLFLTPLLLSALHPLVSSEDAEMRRQEIHFLDVSWLEACATSGKRASEWDFPRPGK